MNHQQQRCGVYQMGRRIGDALTSAGLATYLETWDLGTAVAVVQAQRPRAIIYNWHPSTLPWAPELVRRFSSVKHIGVIHEIAPDAPGAGSDIFPYRVVCDPSFPADGRVLFKTVRHVPRRDSPASRYAPLIIGSFGFAVGGKMFPTIVHAVSQEFPGARVRLRIPQAFYGDDSGKQARAVVNSCNLTAFNGVTVQVEHDFLQEEQLLDWLAGNDLNVFFYEPNGGRGVASALDYAIAVRRPIAVNGSQMFRHVVDKLGTYPKRSLRQSLDVSSAAVRELYDAWTPEQLTRDYQVALGAVGAL